MSNHHAQGPDVSPQNDFNKRTYRAHFPSESDNKYPTSGDALIVNSRCSSEADVCKNAEETSPKWTRSLCKGACLKQQMTRHPSKCRCCCWYTCKFWALISYKNQPRFCLPVSTFGVFPRENPAHAQQAFRFEIQSLFLREASSCISSQKLMTILVSLLHRVVLVDGAGDGDR